MEYAQRRKLQSQETERKILHAALELMRERGFDKVSIRDICKAAGITSGAFYHHFSSKEDMLEYGFAPLDDYMRSVLERSADESPDPPPTITHSALSRSGRSLFILSEKFPFIKFFILLQKHIENNF